MARGLAADTARRRLAQFVCHRERYSVHARAPEDLPGWRSGKITVARRGRSGRKAYLSRRNQSGRGGKRRQCGDLERSVLWRAAKPLDAVSRKKHGGRVGDQATARAGLRLG